MSRNYTSTLLFESALDSIGNINPLLLETANSLFNPKVTIIEEDCGTLLGYPMPISFRAEGNIELQTGLPLTSTRLETLILAGNTTVDIRTLDSCISKDGVCRVCLGASRPNLTPPAVNYKTEIRPEIMLDASMLLLLTGNSTLSLAYDTTIYDHIYVFINGVMQASSTYSVVDKTLTFNTPAVSNVVVVIKYMVRSNVQYYYWLADTFSGSLLGIKSIQKISLPIKKVLLETCINSYNVDSLITQLTTSPLVAEEDFVKYLPDIKDPLEKAILAILLCAIFLN